MTFVQNFLKNWSVGSKLKKWNTDSDTQTHRQHGML
jgi:hypothetical protein